MFSLFLRTLWCYQETNHNSATWRSLCPHWRSWKNSRVSFTVKARCSQGGPSIILYLSFWGRMLKLIKIDLWSTLPPAVGEMKWEFHRHTYTGGGFELDSLQMWSISSYRSCFSFFFLFLFCSSLIDPPEWQLLLDRCRHLLASVAPEVPEENVFKLKMTDMALDASMELGHWEEALRFGQKTLAAYRYGECRCVGGSLFS